VGAKHGASIKTRIMTFGRRISQNIAIIYYITEFKHPKSSIFRNTAVTNIRKYLIYIFQVCTVGQ
jgi:hypothetical protein